VSSSSIRSHEGGTEMAQKVRPNYAMQRSSLVVTPLASRARRVFNATLASGAPTARRR
jgi:hypothetical protein